MPFSKAYSTQHLLCQVSVSTPTVSLFKLNFRYSDLLVETRQETSSLGYNAKLAIIIAPSCVVFLIIVLLLVKLARKIRKTKLGI